MPLIYTVWADWVARAGTESRLKQFAPGDTENSSPLVILAEKSAVGEMNGYLRKRGYRLPLVAPLPDEVKGHLLSLGMQWLTIKSDTDVAGISRPAMTARDYFVGIAKGIVTLGPDADPPTTDSANGDVIFTRQQKVFDFDDETSIAGSRMPKL